MWNPLSFNKISWKLSNRQTK